MKCIKCGAENAEESSFCIQCGNKLESNLNANSEISTNETTTNNVEPLITGDSTNEIPTNNVEPLNTNDSTNEIPTNNVEPLITGDSTNEIPTNNVDSLSVGNSNTTISNVANTIPNNNVTTTEMNNLNNNIKENNGKKKSRVGLVIVLILCLLIIAATTTLLIIWNSDNGKDKTNNINTNNNNSVNSNNSKTNTNNNNNNNNSNTNKDNVINFDNYNVDIDMTMEISGIETAAKFTGTVDEKNQIEYLKMTMNLMGFELSTETYSDIKNGVTYIYEPTTGEWFKENSASKMIDLNGLLQSLKSMNNVEKLDENHFKVKITNSDIKGLLDTSDVDMSSITGDIFAEVFTNNGYVEKIIYDFSQMAQGFESFSVEMRISNYDKAGDVQIPNEAIQSATLY